MDNRFTFTEARVKALPSPAAGRVEYHDTKIAGLSLRVSVTGNRTYTLRYRIRGKAQPERVTIGSAAKLSVEEARKKAQAVLGQVAVAENPAEARRKLRGEPTLGELFDAYIVDRGLAGKRRVDDLRALWERYLGALPTGPRKKHGRLRTKPAASVNWSGHKLSEVTETMIRSLHTRIAKDGHRHTANRVLELLSAVFNYGKRQRLAQANPAEEIEAHEEKDRTRFLKKDELPRFLEALKAEPQPWRDFFTVLLYVGYRRAAVARMAWGDLDLEAGTWSVAGEFAKNGEPIVLAITGPALETLRARNEERESAEWVFPGRSAGGHLTQPKKAWARLLERAGLDDLRIHDLRRTLGSWLAMSGASLPAIGKVLGHKDPRSTQVYARLQTEAAARVLDSAHAAMAQAAAAPVTDQRRASKPRRPR